jgi:translation initiation factor 2A
LGEGGEPEGLDRVAQLRANLEEAIEQEDYSKAASIRDEIQRFTAIVDVQIAEANDRFYKAFESGRLADMRRVWGDGKHVRVIHPGAACIVGRDQVLKSWEHIFQVGGYKIDVEEVQVHAIGGKSAVVTCVEYVDSGPTVGKIVATNVFEKQNSEWKIIHHHGSQPALQ